ncbi:MAG: cysteine--tRNA ligase [Thermanaerothrix sp.]|nr:cysteine--tRNA ligase [Thermanaerothrix sp.]
MAFSIFNDLTNKKEPFVPVEEGKVRFYVCGPTVYDYFHIGNARPFIVFDVMRRYLEYLGYEVKYVQNFTDIDDKMINRANEMGITVEELADRFIEAYYQDADALGIKRATVNPKATDEIPHIIELIETLIRKGHAYQADGDVYFDVKSYPVYGKLIRQDLEELQAGARIEVDPRKRHPLDFALWKAQKPGEPAWESPWGLGRPGWHIECSAMCRHHLGETVDIHGGGCDLVFPHHENEIAQSEAATGKPFVRYWVHNGYLMIDKEKMSKSLGNFMTARDLMKKFHPLVIRLFMLSAHYRSPINFSEDNLRQAQSALERLRNGWAEISFALTRQDAGGVSEELRSTIRESREQFINAMDDDLNTAEAMGAVFALVRSANSHIGSQSPLDMEALEEAARFLEEVDQIMGIIGIEKAQSLDQEVEQLIDQRNRARKERNFKEADAIRDKLLSMGIVLEDTPQGTRWKKA